VTISFFGAARTVTGSRHLLDLDGHRILLDCGLYQGPRYESYERNMRMPFDPASVSCVLLSHAHIDHCGNLPRLVANGFPGPIYATGATCDLAALMLRDSGHIQEKDHEFMAKRLRRRGVIARTPLYTARDVEATVPLFRAVDYGREFEPAPGVRARFRDAGHLLGAAMIEIDAQEGGRARRIVFTGDIGNAQRPILRDPEPIERADVLIMESTYGDRDHESVENIEALLSDAISRVAARRGKVIVPAFSVGRSQTVVFTLAKLQRAGRIPQIEIYIDSPLTTSATEVYSRHPECFDEETRALMQRGDDPFGFDVVRYTRSVEESKALNDHPGPAVIISASGMCESGRILHHLAHTVEDPRHAILIIGFQAQHTLGRRLVEGAERVRIHGEELARRAEVIVLNALSAHADRSGLLRFADQLERAPAQTFLVHGEEAQAMALAGALGERGWRVRVPFDGDVCEIAP
jgi:metallo-beta-lactamase family protein